MLNDFCVFILTHNRHDRIYTYKTLRDKNYTGKIFLVLDDEDKSYNEYVKLYKDQVVVFSKKEVEKTFDIGDNFQFKLTACTPRNACFDIAKKLDYTYFLVLDDDYTDFRWSFDNNKKYVTDKYNQNLDKIFEIMLNFYKHTPFTSIAMAQGGDFIGGEGSGLSQTFINGQISRKVMNSFLCSVNRPFQFLGRMNEDVNTYCSFGNKGHLFMTVAQLRLEQKATQSNAGGLTDLYLDSGTYVKSFYSVLYNPSSVKVRLMGQSNKRLHHSINWNATTPKIISEKFKKYTKGLKYG